MREFKEGLSQNTKSGEYVVCHANTNEIKQKMKSYVALLVVKVREDPSKTMIIYNGKSSKNIKKETKEKHKMRYTNIM